MDINRCAVLVRPRAPFLSWANEHGDGVPYPVDKERTVYLLPTYVMESEAEEVVEHYYDIIFDCELEDWMRDEATWPKDRTYETFRNWFDVEVDSVVVDLVAGEPLVEADEAPAEDVEEP